MWTASCRCNTLCTYLLILYGWQNDIAKKNRMSGKCIVLACIGCIFKCLWFLLLKLNCSMRLQHIFLYYSSWLALFDCDDTIVGRCERYSLAHAKINQRTLWILLFSSMVASFFFLSWTKNLLSNRMFCTPWLLSTSQSWLFYCINCDNSCSKSIQKIMFLSWITPMTLKPKQKKHRLLFFHRLLTFGLH